MELTIEQREQNKKEFIDLVKSITREFDVEYLLKQLENSDFFYAPASTKYHDSCEGGLCNHSLVVYRTLKTLCETFHVDVNEDSIKIVALFHDFSKMNYYTSEIKNKKVYCNSGSKHDSMGNYDWVSYTAYGVRPPEERFIFGNHEVSSCFMINTFIPLTVEEFVAINHHHGSLGWDSAKDDITVIFNRYPLALLLHQADCLAAYGVV